MTTRLPPLSHRELLDLYRRNVELGQVICSTEWTPPPTTAKELIDRIQKGEKR